MSPQKSAEEGAGGSPLSHGTPALNRRRVIAGGVALPVIALGAGLIRAIPASAAPPAIGTEVVVTTDRLNFRNAPSLNAAVLSVLVEGDRGTIIGYPASGTGD